MDIRQARILPALPFHPARYPLKAQALMLHQIFNAHVKAHHGRFLFRDEAWADCLTKEPYPARITLPGGGAKKNAAEAARPFLEAAGVSVFWEDTLSAGSDDYTAYAFYYLLYALYLGTLFQKISAENCAKQLGWLSQVPSHTEAIFSYTYDVKWFARIKALRGAMLFAGDGAGAALANESSRLLNGIALCKTVRVREAPPALSDGVNSLFMAFVLSKADCAWAAPLLDLAKEKGLCAAAVTMHSLQNEMLPHTDACLPFPTVEPIAAPVLGIMPVQIFANDIALSKGLRAHSTLQ